MVTDLHDQRVRLAAFDWLDRQVDREGEVLPYPLLREGFSFEGHRVPLLGPQGIFKPKILALPLSITTAPHGPYEDTFRGDLLQYRYRGTDPSSRNHRDNVGLREAMRLRRPLVYLHGLMKGRYLAAWPVYVVADAPDRMTFSVAVDDPRVLSLAESSEVVGPATEIRRRYVTANVRQRLHQHTFRERVLAAYRDQCALCRLRHRELLQAAHITPDSEPEGEPIVSNGLSLCHLHHAAFDQQILGVRPDYVAQIRLDVLHEIDGPMLRHGLQEMHGVKLQVPRSAALQPDPERLAARYEEFRRSA